MGESFFLVYSVTICYGSRGPPTMIETPTDPVTTTETSFDILDVLKKKEGATITEVSQELNLAPSTAHRHLLTLSKNGFAYRKGNEFHIGFRCLELGIFARQSLEFYEIAKEQVNIIASETGEKTRLITIENGWSVVLYQKLGPHPLKTVDQVGTRRPPHQLAAGKAILAALSTDEVEQIIEQTGLDAATQFTITTPEELFESLETISRRGFGINQSETIIGLNAVGVAFRDENGYPLGGLSVAGPENRLKDTKLRNDLPELLLGAANEIEISLQYT